MILKIILCVIVGYLCGTVSTGYLLGRTHHVDIRNYGSGNAGATNVTRTFGKKAGILVMLGDILKVLIPALLVHYVIFRGEDYATLLCEITGLAGVLGHNFPFWLHFKGGKGVASTTGAMAATEWRQLILVPIFIVIVAVTKYVSVGSIFVMIIFPIFIAMIKAGEPYYFGMVFVACLYMVLGLYSHRENIKRLWDGTERRFGQRISIPEADIKETENA